jgi:hypothetical protein
VTIRRQAPPEIDAGIGHAGATVTVEEAGRTFRITRAGQVVAEVARIPTRPIARCTVRKPQR